ncbi:MAG TPA: hypothetical protein VFX06_02780 [Stellaceae bacterium]|nr:hypothetical protein [Stellaceae bacterium]
MAIEEIDADEATGQATFEVANLRPERMGLPFVVFISQKGGARHDVRINLARHPRVRVSETITVALRPEPRVIRGQLSSAEFDLVRQWPVLNADTLVRYWDGEIEYTEDAIEALKPLSRTDRP